MATENVADKYPRRTRIDIARKISVVLLALMFAACDVRVQSAPAPAQKKILKDLPDGENGVKLGMKFDEVAKIVPDLKKTYDDSWSSRGYPTPFYWESKKFIPSSDVKFRFNTSNVLTEIYISYTCTESNENQFHQTLSNLCFRYGQPPPKLIVQNFVSDMPIQWPFEGTSSSLRFFYWKTKPSLDGKTFCSFGKTYSVNNTPASSTNSTAEQKPK